MRLSPPICVQIIEHGLFLDFDPERMVNNGTVLSPDTVRWFGDSGGGFINPSGVSAGDIARTSRAMTGGNVFASVRH